MDAQLAQEVLLDDPDFLREIVERVLQEELLEAEMTEHIGAAPYERGENRTATATATGRGLCAPGWAR
nr:transposase [Rubrobacter xylanophilus]